MENVFVFIEILFKMLLFKGGVLIYPEHCILDIIVDTFTIKLIARQMDPMQWMGAVRMRVQTADRNITIIHIIPVHELMSCQVNKQITH